MAVAIAAFKIHQRIRARRIGAQGVFNDAAALDKSLPIHRAQEAQTADAIADRNLICRLVLGRELKDLSDGLTTFREALLKPRRRNRQRRALGLQARGEFTDEGVGEGRRLLDEIGEHEHDLISAVVGDREHLLHPRPRQLTVATAGRDVGDDAAEVFEQRETHHDRDRPQLPQRERLHRLIGSDEGPQGVGVDVAVGMRNELEDQVVDARRVRGATTGVDEAGQLLAVAARQVTTCRADLLFDQRVVVDEPLCCWGDPSTTADGLGDQRIGALETSLIDRQSRQQGIRLLARRLCQHMPASERARVMLELTDAEQLGANRQRHRIVLVVDHQLDIDTAGRTACSQCCF